MNVLILTSQRSRMRFRPQAVRRTKDSREAVLIARFSQIPSSGRHPEIASRIRRHRRRVARRAELPYLWPPTTPAIRMSCAAPFDRVFIMGNGGSGKTWLAGRLADVFGHRVIHLDDLHWEPDGYGIARDKAVRDKLVMEAAAAERWIMEGVYGQLVNMVLGRVTTLIWMDLSEEECLSNVRARGIQGDGSETGFRDLLTWVAGYRARKNNWNSFEAHARLFKVFDGSKARLNDRAEIAAYLRSLSD